MLNLNTKHRDFKFKKFNEFISLSLYVEFFRKKE